LIHAFFEQISWLDEGVPSKAELAGIAERLNDAGLDVDQQLADFHAMLDRPAIRDALSRSHYESSANEARPWTRAGHDSSIPLAAEVHNERRFAVRDQGKILSGIIDRLVLLRHHGQVVAAEILDYKTDGVPEDDPPRLAESVEHYRPQVEAYRRAVAKMFRIPPENISAKLLFVTPGIAAPV
jgi:ATP-dependent exoDNAse (exonuclease V) beta subunit